MTEQQQTGTVRATDRIAIYLNRRTVKRLDIPVPHTMGTHNDGWRLDFTGTGKLKLIALEGHNDFIDVKVGDFLLASGEDLFVSLQGSA
ncbi:hypothetical protein ACFY7C_20950 [Streptomyces sp. NPDC012769]|uniref:hypothetical protein n=1 Tax=Streptomyces sp. NPDC012769 TaxID=3364848 RepID=UPI0036B0363F